MYKHSNMALLARISRILLVLFVVSNFLNTLNIYASYETKIVGQPWNTSFFLIYSNMLYSTLVASTGVGYTHTLPLNFLESVVVMFVQLAGLMSHGYLLKKVDDYRSEIETIQ